MCLFVVREGEEGDMLLFIIIFGFGKREMSIGSGLDYSSFTACRTAVWLAFLYILFH